MHDPRIYLDGHARREAIFAGWHAYQFQGWKATPPYDESDPRWWFWMNGLDAAGSNHKGFNKRMEDVDGWKH